MRNSVVCVGIICVFCTPNKKNSKIPMVLMVLAEYIIVKNIIIKIIYKKVDENEKKKNRRMKYVRDIQ